MILKLLANNPEISRQEIMKVLQLTVREFNASMEFLIDMGGVVERKNNYILKDSIRRRLTK